MVSCRAFLVLIAGVDVPIGEMIVLFIFSFRKVCYNSFQDLEMSVALFLNFFLFCDGVLLVLKKCFYMLLSKRIFINK